ncbi:MAG: SCO family protein [Pirellulaceae bacterium]|nr:SCO family protein [Pirellulaceae bacterium]
MSLLNSIRRLALCLVVAISSLSNTASAQILKDEVPDAAKAIDVEDRVGEFIPLDLWFKNERGTAVRLDKFFKADKPIVLTMNYSDCPGLCMAQLNNLVDTLREMNGGVIGDSFDMISVSIDPTESYTKAALTKQKYVGLLSATNAEKGWHFLTGDQTSITALASALGFHYSYDKASKRYSHASVTYFISPEGRICRYFLSLREEPEQFKFALNEAGEGKLTTTLSDTFVQMCYSYDPDANRYTADARRLLAFAAGAFVLMLLGLTAPFWFSGKKNQLPPTAVGSTDNNANTNIASTVATAQLASGMTATTNSVETNLDVGALPRNDSDTGEIPVANAPQSAGSTDVATGNAYTGNIYSDTVRVDPQLSARQER